MKKSISAEEARELYYKLPVTASPEEFLAGIETGIWSWSLTAVEYEDALALAKLAVKKMIKKGSIVAYKDGYYRVSAVYNAQGKCNLASIFHDKIYFKGIFQNEVREAHDEWYAKYQRSETYLSM